VDLYVANYVKFDDKAIPARATTASCRFMATDVFCGPNRLAGEPDVLYRNNGDGTFTDVTARAGIADPGYYGFGVVFADLTGDGWPDIYVANDSVPNLFFRNTGKGAFVEEGLPAGVAVSGDGRPQAGMGVDAGDYNGDGLPDLVVTNFSHDYNTLYENGPPGVFTDRSYAAGIAVTAGTVFGLGRKLVDLDNDGPPRPVHRQRPRLPRCRRPRARHRLPAAQAGVPQRRAAVPRRDRHDWRRLLLERSSRGAAFGDIDNDGDTDILVVNMNERPTLLRNDTPRTHHWMTLRLVGGPSNRSALGAASASRRADGARWRSAQRRQLPLAQRPARARGPGRRDAGVAGGDPLAERKDRDGHQRHRRQVLSGQRGRGNQADVRHVGAGPEFCRWRAS
jgi:hypothetical protein